ncbi:unnamed protein product [Urochloa humidicola]
MQPKREVQTKNSETEEIPADKIVVHVAEGEQILMDRKKWPRLELEPTANSEMALTTEDETDVGEEVEMEIEEDTVTAERQEHWVTARSSMKKKAKRKKGPVIAMRKSSRNQKGDGLKLWEASTTSLAAFASGALGYPTEA